MCCDLFGGFLTSFNKGFGLQFATALKIPTYGFGEAGLGFGFYGSNTRRRGKKSSSGRKMKGRTFKQIARIANPRQYSRSNRPFPGQPFYPQGKP